MDPLIRSISRVTNALANVSSVFQLFFFLVVCSDMISKGFGLVAFFSSVKASSVCIYLSCLVCIQSEVHIYYYYYFTPRLLILGKESRYPLTRGPGQCG